MACASVSSGQTGRSDGGIAPYVAFLTENRVETAKDYVLGLFDRYDIVILCERDHREITQYDLFLDIFRDERFTRHVKNAYFEIGNAKYNDALHAFLSNPALTPEEVSATVMSFQRNSHGAALWEKANYSYYIGEVYQINKNLSPENQVVLRGLDVGVDWDTATESDIRLRDSLVRTARDRVMAENFMDYFRRQNSGKALVVLNFRHAFTRDIFGKENAGRFLAEAFPGKVANVYINSFNIGENHGEIVPTALQDGKWDAACMKLKKTDVGFDLSGTPFGQDPFDIAGLNTGMTYSDLFTGFVYYTPFPDLRVVSGVAGLIDDDFAPELLRRYRLEQKVYRNEIPDIDELKTEFNTVESKTYDQLPDFSEAIESIRRWIE